MVQLVPEPLPDLSTCSQDQELDVTLDDVAPPLSENTQPDTEQGAGTSERESSARGKRPFESQLTTKCISPGYLSNFDSIPAPLLRFLLSPECSFPQWSKRNLLLNIR